MYQSDDTITAVSSPALDGRVIVRVSGPDTINICSRIFTPMPEQNASGLVSGVITIDKELKIKAVMYLFVSPHSYTGQDITEFHFYANSCVTESLIAELCANGAKMAQPGEFTARAYFNGKIDLAQAEAVNEIISSSNRFQLAAAEKLLTGRLSKTTEEITGQIVDCLSLIEAGFDFSEEDIEFITKDEAAEKITELKNRLEQLQLGSITCESIIDLPAVGIAGAPNAGKSSLLNKLLGHERSIVSYQRKTTRDVLSGQLELRNTICVLFDCAGLMPKCETLIDELAQNSALDAIQKASIAVFCVDISKTDWNEDIAIRKLINPDVLITIATKSDLLTHDTLKSRLDMLNELFNTVFVPVSVETDININVLRKIIDEKILQLLVKKGSAVAGGVKDSKYGIALTARHKQAVTDASESLVEAAKEIQNGNSEIAAMMLRTAHRSLATIEQESLDEKILDNIFNRFCIGK